LGVSWDDSARVKLARPNSGTVGLGDQHGYAGWFQEPLALCMMRLTILAVNLSGSCLIQTYEFNTSQKRLLPMTNYFVGLV